MALPVYATKEQYSEFWGYWQHKIDLDRFSPEEVTALDSQLQIAAGDINQMIRQVGALDCSFDSYALDFLTKLNCINTAVTYRVPCGPRLTDDDLRYWTDWLDKMFGMIRTGELELCEGSTGKNYPAFEIAQQSWTEFNAVQLIRNRALRRRF
jgi:hypothetical protein